MRAGRVVWLCLGLAVLLAACGDGGTENLSTDAGFEAGDDRANESRAAEQPSIPPEEGGAAAEEPIIPPEEGGPAPTAPRRSAPTTTTRPSDTGVSVSPSPATPQAVAPAPPAPGANPVPVSPGNVGTPADAPTTSTTAPAAASPAPLQESGVYGRVTSGAGGAPLAGAAVEASANDQPSALLAAVTDGNGRYAWPLDPDTVICHVPGSSGQA